MTLRCEDVREILPRYAEWGPRPAGEVERHLATCEACTAELASYREVVSSLNALRETEIDAPRGYLERTLALVPAPAKPGAAGWREVPERVVAAARRRPAAASVTGAVIGAAAIGLVLWRRGRRAIQEAARVPELAAR